MPAYIAKLTGDRKLAEAYRLALITFDTAATELERDYARTEALAILATIPEANH
jgi:hypothetical protein